MGIADTKRAAAAAAAQRESATPPPDAPALPGDELDEEPQAAEVPNWYCLDHRHTPAMVSRDRLFYYGGEAHPPGHPLEGELVMVDQGNGVVVPDTSKAPICPRCTQVAAKINPLTGLPVQVRVSACAPDYDEAGNPVIPAQVLGIAQRAGELVA